MLHFAATPIDPQLIELVSKLLGLVVTAFAAIGSIISFTKGGVDGVKSFFRGAWNIFVWITSILHGPWTIPAAQKQIQKSILEIDKRQRDTQADIEYIRHEQTANGWTSQKDISLLLLGQWKMSKRRATCPLFIRDSEGKNIVVSRAYCDMLDLNEEENLLEWNWKRFIYHEDVDHFFHTFLQASENRSVFRGVARYVDVNGTPLGTWEAIAEPLIREKNSRLVYEGYVRPLDAKAKSIADSFGFNYDAPIL